MTGPELSRRRFLAGTAAACTAGVVTPLFRPQMAFAGNGLADHTLVLVVLEGGLDALSALVPAGDAAYGRNRRATLVADNTAIGVDPMFGLHPALAPMAELWTDGLVAAIPAVGSPTRSRSHASELAVVAEGTGGQVGDGTGWLARHLLTSSGGAPVILHGIAAGSSPAGELAGHLGSFHLPDLATTGIGGWDSTRLPDVEAGLAAAYAAAGGELAGPAAMAFEAVQQLRSTALSTTSSVAAYEEDHWASQLRTVGQLIRAGVGMEAAVVSFSGWDTHRDQGGVAGALAYQLGRLGRALAAFAADMHDRLAQVTVVVVSEFGRRVAENSSGGTDHGHGGLALVLGGGVQGGVHGPWPGLDDGALDDGDLAVATDVRSVLAEVVRGRLGNDAVGEVFPGFAPTPIGFA